MARAMWEHLLLMAVEMAHAPRKIHWTNWRDYITLVRKDYLVDMLLQDRPSMLVCGHFGNFELSGYVLAQLGFPNSSIARPLDNRHLDAFVNSWRGSHGQYIIPKTGSSAQVDALLASGGLLTPAGRSACRPERLLGRFFRSPGLDPQSRGPVGAWGARCRWRSAFAGGPAARSNITSAATTASTRASCPPKRRTCPT